MSLKITVREPKNQDILDCLGKEDKPKFLERDSKESSLETDEVLSLLKLLPPYEEEQAITEEEFFQREKSFPVPEEGEVMEQFTYEKMEDGKREEMKYPIKDLKVVRKYPVGNVSTANKIRIAFNQPIVPLTGLNDLPDVPIEITPKPKGTWKYINSTVVSYETEHRFDKSTKYTVKVPKGMKGLSGGELKKTVTFTFVLPVVKLKTLFPSQYQCKKDQLFYMEFDQRVSKESLSLIKCKIPVKQPKRKFGTSPNKPPAKKKVGPSFDVVVVSKEEAQKYLDHNKEEFEKKFPYINMKYNHFMKKVDDEKSFWIRFNIPLKLGRKYDFIVPKGFVSSEGTLKKKRKTTWNFRTYPGMKKASQYPGRKGSCYPNSQLTVSFTNAIDLEHFTDDFVKVKPHIRKMKVRVSENSIFIEGRKRGSTSYTITISEGLMDVYGQKLKKEVKCVMKIDKAPQSMRAERNFFVVNPWNKKELSLFVTNIGEVSVKAYSVLTTEFECLNGKKFPKALPKNKTIKTEVKKDIESDVKIDLTEFLKHKKEGVGQLLLYIEPTKASWEGEWRDRPKLKTWIQITNIGLFCLGTNEKQVHFFCCDLRTGAPLPNPKFTLTYIKRMKKKNSYDHIEKEIKKQAEGDDTGHGMIQLKSTIYNGRVVAKVGKDVAFTSRISNYESTVGNHRMFIYNDRKMYKPKEKVTIKGHLRFVKREKGFIKLSIPKNKITFQYKANDSRGKEMTKGKVETDENGHFNLEVEIPDSANLGTANVSFVWKKEGKKQKSPKKDSPKKSPKKKKKPPMVTVMEEYHYFEIQEFRRPIFETHAKVEGKKPFLIGGKTIVKSKSSYFSGGNISFSRSDWTINQRKTSFYPPGNDKFSFSSTYELKKNEIQGRMHGQAKAVEVVTPERLKGKTNSNGEHYCLIEYQSKSEDPKERLKTPVNISCQCIVEDNNNQALTCRTSFVVHPCSLYLGLKTEQRYAVVGEDLKMEFIVTDIEGNVLPEKKVQFKVVKRTTEKKGYAYITNDEDMETVVAVSDGKPKLVEIKVTKEGRYFVIGEVEDDFGNKNTANINGVTFVGQKSTRKTSVRGKAIDLTNNKKKYFAGDEAKIMVENPFDEKVQGILLGFTNCLVFKKRIELTKKLDVVTVPILDQYVPKIDVRLYLFASEKNDEDMNYPVYASGSTVLNIESKEKVLTIEIEPTKKILRPQESSVLKIKVIKDKNSPAEGRKALVTVAIVDESILSMTGYTIPDIHDYFFTPSYISIAEDFIWSNIYESGMKDVATVHGRGGGYFRDAHRFHTGLGKGRGRRVRTAKPSALRSSTLKEHTKNALRKKKSKKKGRFGEGTGAEDDDDELVFDDIEEKVEENKFENIKLRKDFNPLVFFKSDLETSEGGEISVDFKMNDSLSKYTIFAVATLEADHFGITQESISTKNPISVMSSLPRFLNVCDENVQLAFTIYNQLLEEVGVNVACRVKNLKMVDPTRVGLSVKIPAQQRVVVKFPVNASLAGEARIQLVSFVRNIEFVDKLEKTIPIFTPATSETFSRTVAKDEKEITLIQPYTPPTNVFSNYGGIDITVSSTILQKLLNVFVSLYGYKFSCVEQTASRIFSIISMKKILEDFNSPKLPKKARMEHVVKESINCLEWSMSTEGFYRFWARSSRINYYLSIYCGYVLTMAKAAGHRVSIGRLQRSKRCLMRMKEILVEDMGQYNKKTCPSLEAFAYFVVSKMHEKKITKLVSKADLDKTAELCVALVANRWKFLSIEAKCWIGSVLHVAEKSKKRTNIVKRILTEISNNVDEKNETAEFIDSYGEDSNYIWMHSNKRTGAIVLEFLLVVDPKNEIIPKILRSLLGGKKFSKKFSSTQEDIFILLALRKYYDIYEKDTPNFNSKIWFDTHFVNEYDFKGREKALKSTNIPMKYLTEGDKKIVVSKKGKGRMYCRLSLTYAKKDVKCPGKDMGFRVERNYMSTQKDEKIEMTEAGEYKLNAGKVYKVELKVMNVARRVHVALCDYLPAGFETLKTPIDFGVQQEGGFNRHWYEHVNFRDERTEVFAGDLYTGEHKFVYFVRATNVGKYVAQPCKAEEMYQPEVFGTSPSEIVIIE